MILLHLRSALQVRRSLVVSSSIGALQPVISRSPIRQKIREMSEFKVKGLTSLELKDGETKEVEIEGIEEGKILLAKSGGKVYATGSKCTHYGAPLVKGVVDQKGSITCPWHGGEF